MPDFYSPSFRAAQSDLTIAVSPLGLIELSDEEFEVHGPRLNRYAAFWAHYLGHHWAHRRPAGETNLTFNYSKAFADYILSFTFGRGITFRTPLQTEAIVPNLLNRVWTVDNNKEKILWDMGQVGGVTGDCFVKVAYEDPFVDPSGRLHAGRVRILPINSSFVFPEWHPHDKERMIRCKIKYRFWGTAPDGTRQVFTYVEIMTDEWIEEYINDELIDEPRPNPIGTIPVIHIPNTPVQGSPWGLSDIQDISVLNREFNEKATDISDIINYHAAPVTVITGAKASQLEKGPNKVWGGLPEKANVFNLQMSDALSGPLEYLNLIKRGMHEMTGVPETALGQRQPISNTSGVALAIEYQPLMNRFNMKKMQYGYGLQRVNELVLLTLVAKETDNLVYNPTEESELKPGQVAQLDPADPITYRTEVVFPPPLPTDTLVKLNEIQAKQALGLESKRGALRELGEEFPDEKMAETYDELRQDLLEQGALDLLRASITSMVMNITGMGGADEEAQGGSDVASAGGPTVTHATGSSAGGNGEGGGDTKQGILPGLPGAVSFDPNQLLNQIVTMAYGTKLAQRRSSTRTRS